MCQEARCSSVVERLIIVQWVIGLILYGGLIKLFQPVLHNWCIKGRGMCCPVWDDAYKRTLAANQKE